MERGPEAGKPAPWRQRWGLISSSHCQSGAVTAAKSAVATGRPSASGSGVSSISACLRKVEPMKSGGAG